VPANETVRSSVVLGMRPTTFLLLLPLLSLGAGCRESPSHPPAASASLSAEPAAASAVVPEQPAAAASDVVPAADPMAPAMTDGELGRLINALSEPTGDFPSDNFVSNETSYLHVAPALLDEKMRGKAYVGVGPEQNLTYVAMMQPAMAYIVDIRRQNMLQHLLLRALAEDARDRAAFLERLTARRPGCCGVAKPELASFDELADALAKTDASDEAVQAEVERTLALMGRLGVVQKPGDEGSLRKVLQAFAKGGLDLAYSMKGSGRKYPSLRKLLAMEDDEGKQRSFLSDEESFSTVQGLLRANRVVPVVGDFSGERALRGVAADMRRRELTLGVFYTSNVEQYLFEGGSYGTFVRNVETFPIDETSSFLRVWFDQGRAHPKQREGHRTTSLVTPVGAFLARHAKHPFATYWHVTTFVHEVP